MIKKTAILINCVVVAGLVSAQSVEQAKKEMYYTRWESAKENLLPLIKRSDVSPETFYLLGEVYLEENKTDSAGMIFTDGIKIADTKKQPEKNYPLIYMGKAHWMLATGQKDEAVKLMNEVLDATKHKDAAALLAAAKANIDSENGDAKWALELLEQAAKRDKKNPAVYSAMGDAYRKLVDGSNAVLSYQKALDVDPRYAEAWYKLGKVFKTQDNVSVYLDRFTKAFASDENYTPALYELYNFYFYRGDVDNAKNFLERYIKNSDPSPRHDYMIADLDYISKQYKDAIAKANFILDRDKDSTQPRIYKLIAYSYEGLGDSAQALQYINQYFDKQDTAGYVAKDFELKARLLDRVQHDEEAAAQWYEKAYAAETKEDTKQDYAKMIALLYKNAGDRLKEAEWRGTYYNSAKNPTNLDLYNWGLALYTGQAYQQADSIFAQYEEKYPDQVYGYLWRAMCNALIDSTMELGLAVPHYEKLIEVASKDSVANKSNLIKAYGYIGAYKANVEKNYPESVAYFNKILELDPGNADATRYVTILQKWIDEGKGVAGSQQKESAGSEEESSSAN
ncbi:MAG TPA: tetratricopeptide repeat protein [Chitinophagaceae bacterium]|nr:tetratricopeptide repeat protein [Chitinophagaceae bacterium]